MKNPFRKGRPNLLILIILFPFFQNDLTALDTSPPVNGTVYTTSVKIKKKNDDGEERIGNGRVNLKSKDLEMVEKSANKLQLVAYRFDKLNVPKGATIVSAYIQFTASKTSSTAAANLTIYGEADDNSKKLEKKKHNISNRVKTNTFVGWSPPAWNCGDAGIDQRTPDLSTIIQEIVDIPGTKKNHKITLIVSGSGLRTAESKDGSYNGAAELVVEYTIQCAIPSATTVCHNIGDDHFYIEVTLGSGSNVRYDITNSYNSDKKKIKVGETKEIGPFPNNTSVDVTVEAKNYSECSTSFIGMTGDCQCTDYNLAEHHYEKTTPFVNTTTSLKDGEGMTYVPSDGSLWLLDDNTPQIAEMDASNGTLKSLITKTDLENTQEYGGNTPAGNMRVGDLEAGAYDPNADHLYIFSGVCCTGTPHVGTAFRLTRNGAGNFVTESWQGLPIGTDDFPAAGFHPSDGLYVASDKILRRYDYENNTFDNMVDLNGFGIMGSIYGMSFSDNGNVLWIVTSSDIVYKIDWNTIPNITILDFFNLFALGLEDGRGVDMVNGQLCVIDGNSSPLNADKKFAVTYFDLVCDTGGGSYAAPASNNEEFKLNHEAAPIKNNEIQVTNQNGVLNNVSKNEEELLNIFPNPASDVLGVNISVGKETSFIISIVDALGQTVFTETMVNRNFKEINISKLPNGAYMLSLEVKNGETVSKPFIKF